MARTGGGLVRKAVIPAAGEGRRLRPLSFFTPKEMLKLGGLPVIAHVAGEALQAGVEELIIVISPRKTPLRAYLEKACPCAVKRFVIQAEPLGLGHAVLEAREAVGGEPFLVLLPDEVYLGRPSPSVDLARRFLVEPKPLLSAATIERGALSSWGVIAGTPLDNGAVRVDYLVEKPRPGEAPSRLVILGRYLLTPDVFSLLEAIPPGRNGEYQLTDALSELARQREVLAWRSQARRYSLGTLGAYLVSRMCLRGQRASALRLSPAEPPFSAASDFSRQSRGGSPP